MEILLTLAAAVSYGVSDFAGGVLTRRAHVFVVLLLSQLVSFVRCSHVHGPSGGDPSRLVTSGLPVPARHGQPDALGHQLLAYGARPRWRGPPYLVTAMPCARAATTPPPG